MLSLKDVFSTKTFQFPPSVVVLIITSLLIICNYFLRTYFSSFQWQLVVNDNAGLEGRGAVLWFPVVCPGKKKYFDTLDGVLTQFIKPLSEDIMWYVVLSLAVIPKMAINGLVNLWIEIGKSGLWDNWKDITCNVSSGTEGGLLLFRDRGNTLLHAILKQGTQYWSTLAMSKHSLISCTMHFLHALLLSPSYQKSYFLADSFNFHNEKLRLQNRVWKARKIRDL